LEPRQYIDALEAEGTRLAETAAGIAPETPVPTCPDWTLRDLVRHVGGVHRWAGEHIRNRRASVLGVDDFEDLVGPWPADSDLADWYRAELDLLVQTLRSAPPGIDCVTFLKSRDPLSFWARRQAHEATIHRADVESIAGSPTAVSPEFALDGIDELLNGFVPRPFMKLRSPAPKSLCVAPKQGDRVWTLSITEQPVTVSTERQECDCVISGDASRLYFALWNRAGDDGLENSGDRSVFALFRSKIAIKWA
jgi:uncharacterized protein (TIGR03083 family)